LKRLHLQWILYEEERSEMTMRPRTNNAKCAHHQGGEGDGPGLDGFSEKEERLVDIIAVLGAGLEKERLLVLGELLSSPCAVRTRLVRQQRRRWR
jgi:hypothetical protein